MKKIGIIGGAGPMASLLLHQMIIEIFQKKYKCKNDEDFPFILHLSYPFSDMLKKQAIKDTTILEKELESIFKSLKKHKLDFICIACNTLHIFIKKKPKNFLDLIEETQNILKNKKTLIFCTSNSKKSKVHKNINSIYPDEKDQKKIDLIIDEILSGKISKKQTDILLKIAKKEMSRGFNKILLGCTELSLLHKKSPFVRKDRIVELIIVDPIEIIAKKLVRLVRD